MSFDFAATKTLCRQVVHDTLGVEAFYKPDTASTPITVTARWHEKKVMQGQIQGEGAQIFEGIDHVVFNIPQLTELGLTLQRGGILTFPGYQNFTVMLDVLIETDGPVEQKWAITRMS